MLEIENHYGSARSRALSYLLTVGAKALVLASTKDQALVYRGLDEELAVRAAMILEEQARQLRRHLAGKEGVMVYKRARNGEIRKISIKFRCVNGVDCIQWRSKSFPYLKKSFAFDALMEVNYMSNDDKLVGVSRRGSARGLEDLPYVRIKSEGRDLDLVFATVAETDSFMFLLINEWGGISQ